MLAEVIFLSLFVFGILYVSIWVVMEKPSIKNLEGRTTNLEVRADVLEENVGSLHTITNQSLAYLRKMNSTVDIITDGLSLAVPPDHVPSTLEERPQQGAPRGVSREFHF